MNIFASYTELDIDLFGILLVYVVAVVFMLAGYRQGGRSWTSQFAIRKSLSIDSPARYFVRESSCIPGQFGELATLTLLFTLVFLVDRLTSDVTLYAAVIQHKLIVIGLLVLGFGVVLAYSLWVCRSAVKKGEVPKFYQCISDHPIDNSSAPQRDKTFPIFYSRLRKGYICYNFFSTAIFTGVVCLPYMILAQWSHDLQGFGNLYASLRSLLESDSVSLLSQPELMSHVEIVYGLVRSGALSVTAPVNTALLLLIASYAIYYAVAFTPLKEVYTDAAVKVSKTFVYVSIFTVIVVAWIVYFRLYSEFYTYSIQYMESYAHSIAQSDWEIIGRYNELMLDLGERKGLTGFLFVLTSERGSLLIILPLLQQLLERRKLASKAV